MELSISGQAFLLLCFSCLGLALGLLYDLLRPFRYFLRADIIWDALFCAAAALGCFSLSMGTGRLGVWDMAAALLFFCLYINFLSPLLLPWILGIFRLMRSCISFAIQSAKKLQISVKKFFTNGAN